MSEDFNEFLKEQGIKTEVEVIAGLQMQLIEAYRHILKSGCTCPKRFSVKRKKWITLHNPNCMVKTAGIYLCMEDDR